MKVFHLFHAWRKSIHRVLPLFLGILTVVLLSQPLLADTTQTHPYQGAVPSAATSAYTYPLCAPTYPNIGGACFLMARGAKTINVNIKDASGKRVAGNIEFARGYEPSVWGPKFCGSVANVPVPPRTEGVIIRTLAADSLNCAGGGVPNSGTISVTFHN